jgi:hypothetical protein
MRIYEPLYDDGYEFCHPVDDNFRLIVDLCNGAAHAQTWKPLSMELIRNDEGKRLVESDSPWLGSYTLLLRPKAIAALHEMLLQYGELLPMHCAGAEIWLYNVTNVIDALDEAASTIDRFPDGRIILVKRPVLRKEVVGNDDIFKVSRRRADSICFSQRFVDLWRSAGLTGIEFDQIWAG